MIVTPEVYMKLPQPIRTDRSRVMVSGLVPMQVQAVRKEGDSFFALVTIPFFGLNDTVREIPLNPDEELLVINKEPPVTGAERTEALAK